MRDINEKKNESEVIEYYLEALNALQDSLSKTAPSARMHYMLAKAFKRCKEALYALE